MAFCIMRIEKRKAGSLGGLEAEANRTEKINLPKSDIDWSKTPENKYLLKADNWKKTIDDILKDHNITKVRKDAVLLVDGLYTASPEFFEGKEKEEILDYFRDCLTFHSKHFGEPINAVVHLDERTPHLHIASVPLIDRGEGKYSLSAKDLLGGKNEFHKWQNLFFTEVGEKRGLERGETSDPATKREHLDSLDYKAKVKEEEIEKKEAEKIELEEQIGKLEKVRGIMERLSITVELLANKVIDFFRAGFEKLCEAIESKKILSGDDLESGSCTMQRNGNITNRTTGEKWPLFSPATDDIKFLTWAGHEPLYIAEEGHYLGVGAKDPAGAIDILNNDEWKTNICKEKRDNITLPIEHETDFIEQDIKEIMEITAPDAEDERPPEEIDEIKENDLEIDPFSIDEDEEEEDCIDFDEE